MSGSLTRIFKPVKKELDEQYLSDTYKHLSELDPFYMIFIESSDPFYKDIEHINGKVEIIKDCWKEKFVKEYYRVIKD